MMKTGGARMAQWFEFVVGSRPCSERFFSDLESEGHKFISLGLLRATLVKQRLFLKFIFLIILTITTCIMML